MLKISKLADYGTAVMAYMAKDHAKIYNARDIAAHTQVALPTVSKILKRLAHSGLLLSQRGVKGGYQLAKSAEKISVAAIIQAMDGDFALTECSHASPGMCSLEPVCATRANWRLINKTIYQALDRISLADMKVHMKTAPMYLKPKEKS